MLSFSGEPELVSKFIKKVQGVGKYKELVFDFNRIVRMPKDLDVTESSDGDAGMRKILADRAGNTEHNEEWEGFKKHRTQKDLEEALALGQKYLDNLEKYGYKSWYDWRRDKWGTKWNACSPTLSMANQGAGVFQFDTAWSAPVELIELIVKRNPDIQFNFVFADEDISYNTGSGYSDGGHLYMTYPPGGSDEAYELYFQTHEDMRDELVKVNGEWRWIDDLKGESEE